MKAYTQRCGEIGTGAHGRWKCKLIQALWKTTREFLGNEAQNYHRIEQVHSRV